jgi:hypothetical protein
MADADSARAAVQNMLQACIDASAERALKVLPQIDAASALAGADQTFGLDSDAIAAPQHHSETIAPDEVRSSPLTCKFCTSLTTCQLFAHIPATIILGLEGL